MRPVDVIFIDPKPGRGLIHKPAGAYAQHADYALGFAADSEVGVYGMDPAPYSFRSASFASGSPTNVPLRARSSFHALP